MTEYAYDPELPFAVVSNEEVRGRAKFADEARVFAQYYIDGQVIDTNPKPKIPEDAEFIFWPGGPLPVEYYARRVGHPGNKVWRNDEGEQVDEEVLLIDIGDAEVTVLVPKEES